MRLPALLRTLAIVALGGFHSMLLQSQSVPSPATIRLIALDGQQQSVDAKLLRTLPRITVHVHNAHTQADEVYEGPELAALLARIETPLGTKLHGKSLSVIVVATGADQYRAVYSLAEVDPQFHTGHVLVADRVNGQPIGDREGPFKLVNTEDQRSARWVRNLASLQVEMAP